VSDPKPEPELSFLERPAGAIRLRSGLGGTNLDMMAGFEDEEEQMREWAEAKLREEDKEEDGHTRSRLCGSGAGHRRHLSHRGGGG
jgi:hypothetical protein